jgi:hypothetical protein
MTERVRAREIDDDEGRRLVRIIRRGSGSTVTWRRAQVVLAEVINGRIMPATEARRDCRRALMANDA